SIGFIIGAILSLLAAYIGMSIAVRANVRTSNAARTSGEKALKIAFLGGSVTGLTIVGLSLLGVGGLYIIFGQDPSSLVGFGFGASLAALFAQLGGGIYTKAADVGADLVGKVEQRIPEDDPRNPAVIADQVGDNVGDCAGRGADLFESFSDNIIGIMILGASFAALLGSKYILYPLLAESIGVIGVILGVLLFRPGKNPMTSIYTSFAIATIVSLIGFYWLGAYYMNDIRLFYTSTLGVITSFIVAVIILYYTGNHKPVIEIARASKMGAAINLIQGLAYGFESAVGPVIIVAIVIGLSYIIGGGGIEGIYGIASAAAGILSTTGIIMTADTFGPISDNADGIAEMAGISDEVADKTEMLDAAGNVTKAVTKGYAMACATITSIVLLFAFIVEAGTKYLHINIGTLDALLRGNLMSLAVSSTLQKILSLIFDPYIIIALFIGSAVPFLFSSMAIKAVGKTAFQMVDEVRRQFREIKGLLEGKAKPDYARAVDISTRNALREMVPPTLLGLIAPVIMGFVFGVKGMTAYLIGVTLSAVLLALFMYNVGGAWDNAKKYIEAGNFGGKGTDAHAAAVIGDTVGDPLKDTAGPSLHILIKLQNIMAITLLPLFVSYAILL
ncbi:MAG: sodium-translocating pyrophosphatase, partial [Thermoprotei archaeon]